nr:cation/H+ exchanger, cation/H+ exchanger, CPA1 family [Tanacetum cinerariifolium]
MEQKQSSSDSVRDQLLPFCGKYPWFVAQNLKAEENCSRDPIFYTAHDPLTKYQCQITEMMGRHIRGYYHGWVILSNHPQNVMWSLWNPVTSKMIKFPPLILKDGNSEPIDECCLSAPPDNPSSILMLTRPEKHTFVFYRLEGKRKRLRWIEMTYASQLKKITGDDDSIIYNLACCNGKVYALNAFSAGYFVIQLDILVKDKEVLINLLLIGATPIPSWYRSSDSSFFLKGYCTELFCIMVCFYEQKLEGVYIFKLDMTRVTSEEMERFKGLDMSSKRWQEVEDWTDVFMSQEIWEPLVDLKEAIFFVDLAVDYLVYYRPAVASELGGYIHIRDKMGKILYSHHVKDNTVSLSSMPSLVLPTSIVSLWEYRLEDDHEEARCTDDSKQEVDQIVGRAATHNEIGLESNLLNLPSDILEMIIKRCIGVEYMSFRATCKSCHVAAPLIKWSNETSVRRLQTYSFVSPCDLRKLPEANYNFTSMCFSAPPTSPDCMVVGFPGTYECIVLIHFVAREPSWHLLKVIVGKFGELVDVFKWNDSKQEWLKVDNLGKHVIYICGTTCLSIEAKTPEMENLIFFPLLCSKNKKIVFYSLETGMYHTINGGHIQQHFMDFLGTTYHLFPHAWIEPSWS